ncbi:inhibitor of Bruton tyrosine kinase [Chrysoperla carnea]|uniref:inhibitor of Bruton tyrosine kinase n=1 Tax=Chrysoperla carnea TaxID=189513 RepID=UPI001D079D7C|nr:inhibitor of Bruton tyrosine kinase [Chrysoperla carnea]
MSSHNIDGLSPKQQHGNNDVIHDCNGFLCKSKIHGNILNSTLTKRALTSKELCGYLNWVCGNCAEVIDSVGRSTLHIAASRGLKDVVEWLINCKHANIELKDLESGYTPLHRSVFYGQIHVAVHLIKNGSNLQALDRDHLTPLDHVMKDRFSKIRFNPEKNSEVYMWGTNSNYTLGMQQTKPYPELLSKQNIDVAIKQVCLRKFHCVMISKDGRAFSCGHGQGGRLGLGDVNTAMKPTQINFHSRTSPTNICKQAAIGRDHSMFLMDSNTVWVCGLNEYHVLGLSPPPEMLLQPKALPEFKTDITGICAGRFHSVAWCESTLYTWGLNAGQLGHDITSGKTVIMPKQVATMRGNNFLITDVAVSDGATVVAVKRGDIYVLHEYQCRKIASKQTDVVKVAVVGGHLNEKLDKNLLKERDPLRVLVITIVGDILLWQESTMQLTRCIFSLNRELIFKDAVLNKSNVLLVTNEGEAFQGQIKERKIKPVDQKAAQKKSAFHKFLDKNDCELIALTRLRNVHRAVNISSDTKGRNFCVLQNDPRTHLSDESCMSSNFKNDLLNLLQESDEMDFVHDVLFKVEKKLFPVHRFIIASSSTLLNAKIEAALPSNIVEIPNIRADIFSELLEFIYTKSCNLLRNAGEVIDNFINEDDKQKSAFEYYRKKVSDNKKMQDVKNPIRVLQAVAKQLGVMELYRYIESSDVINGTVIPKKDTILRDLTFDREAFSELYDVKIQCENGQHIKAHKCILAGRLDYFNNLFAVRWNENTNRTTVTLPFPFKIVSIVVEFLYTDSAQFFIHRSDVDQLCHLIVVADQLFLLRLKEICEVALIKKLTLRNTAQILQFADLYNCEKLKACSMEFICLNLAALLENRSLECLEDSVLEELSTYYWDHNPKLHTRLITPYSDASSDEVVKSVCDLYPVNLEHIDDEADRNRAKLNHKKKIRTRKLSQTESPKDKNHNNSISSNISENESEIFTLERFIDKEENGINSDWIQVNKTPQQKIIQARLKAIGIMKDEQKLNKPIVEEFTTLNTIESINSKSPENKTFKFDFPELSSSKSNSIFDSAKSPPKYDFPKMHKLSQKQRKRLSSENSMTSLTNNLENVTLKGHANGEGDTVAEKKNPWKKVDVVPEQNINSGILFPDIIACEQKKKENLTKMIAKPLILTQIEDRAIEDIKRFYNVENVFEEYLTVQRVTNNNIAVPQWVKGRSK